MSGHIALGCFALVALILIVDWAVGTVEQWRKERKREREMRKYNLAAFRGARRTDEWMS